MKYTVNFNNFSNKDGKKLCKIFSKQILTHAENLQVNDCCDEYINKCIDNAYKIFDIEKKIGSAQRVTDSYSSCVFCNTMMRNREMKHVLNCGHQFHKKCLNQWMYKYNAYSCPACGADF